MNEEQPKTPITPGSTYTAHIKWMPDCHDEIERLRSLLTRLEWAQTVGSHRYCAVCDVERGEPHVPSCWLAAELHPGPS